MKYFDDFSHDILEIAEAAIDETSASLDMLVFFEDRSRSPSPQVGVVKSTIKRLRTALEKFWGWVTETLGKLFNRKEVSEVTTERAKAEGIVNIEINQTNSLIIKEAEKTKSLLEKCKTPAELERVMTQYRKKVARIKAMKKAGRAIIIVSAAAMIGWLHHTKKVKIEECKREVKKQSDQLAKLETKLIDKRTAASKERAVLRTQLEIANGEKLQMSREVEKMKLDNTRATQSGQLQGAADLQKAHIEVAKDQITAIVDQSKEIISKVTSPNSNLGEKVGTVKNAPKSLREAMLASSESKTVELKDGNREIAALGKQVKQKIDKAMDVLDSDTVDLNQRRNALDCLVKYEPVLRQLGGRYAVRARGIISRENSERKRRADINGGKPLSLHQVFSDTAIDNIRRAVVVIASPKSTEASKEKARSYLRDRQDKLMIVKDSPVAKKALALIR